MTRVRQSNTLKVPPGAKRPNIGIIEVPDTDPVEYVYGGRTDPAVNDTLQSDCAGVHDSNC